MSLVMYASIFGMCIYMHMNTHAHTHVFMRVCVYVYVYVYVCVCAYVCVCVFRQMAYDPPEYVHAGEPEEPFRQRLQVFRSWLLARPE